VTTRRFHGTRLPREFHLRPLLASSARIFLLALLACEVLASGFAAPPAAAAPLLDQKAKPYALIFGTVWGPDDRPVYGVTVHIRLSTDKPKKVRWELYSDHHGEFAQRVPAGEADYIVSADLKGVKTADGAPLHLVQEVKVHIYNDEREDMGLHLTR
jgi:hypothetical protein